MTKNFIQCTSTNTGKKLLYYFSKKAKKNSGVDPFQLFPKLLLQCKNALLSVWWTYLRSPQCSHCGESVHQKKIQICLGVVKSSLVKAELHIYALKKSALVNLNQLFSRTHVRLDKLALQYNQVLFPDYTVGVWLRYLEQ